MPSPDWVEYRREKQFFRVKTEKGSELLVEFRTLFKIDGPVMTLYAGDMYVSGFAASVGREVSIIGESYMPMVGGTIAVNIDNSMGKLGDVVGCETVVEVTEIDPPIELIMGQGAR